MLYYIIVAALILHMAFWGAGLSWLALPGRWRRWWWVFAPGCGIALQSAVVWAGAHTALAGTNAYATWSELLPAALLVVAFWRHGWARLRGWLAAAAAGRGVLLLAVLAGGLLLWPMTQRGKWTLTSSSLGSCDQADYAAGTRVLQEFARDDRTGFLGLTEVTHVGTSETFFDFWLRLNHFTPSALMAHQAAVFDLQPHQLVSVNAVMLLLLNAAPVLLLARLAGGLRGWTGLVPVALYLLSPLGAYAVHHGALGQLYAAHGIALLTLATFAVSRGQCTLRGVWAWAPLTLTAFWILAGSYNFVLTVALAPAVLGLGIEMVRWRDWRGGVRVLAMLLAMLAVCAGLFWGRFSGLIERFQLFEQYNFGWPVPLLSPEGWLGMLRDTGLFAWPREVRLALSGLLGAIWLAGFLLLWRRRRDTAIGTLVLVLPVLAGWAILVWETRTRANASYDAFKLFSVFYPGLLAAFAGWLLAGWAARPMWLRAGGAILLGGALLNNAVVAWSFARQMADPPLRVEHSLVEVRRLERMPRITSLNMRIDDFWSRLWANELLLRKPQYFPVHTYEGRLNTELQGAWDLSDGLLRSLPARPVDYVVINAQFHAVRVGAPGLVALAFGAGWHAPEGQGLDRWRWSSGPGEIRISNPGPGLRISLELRVRPLQPAELQLDWGGGRTSGGRWLNGTIQRIEYNDVFLPPGGSTLTLKLDRPPARAGAADARLLGLSLYELTVRAEP